MTDSSSNGLPELASDLFDRLTGRGAEITYDFQNLEVHVPASASDSAAQAPWKVNGVLKIRTSDTPTG